MAVTSFLRFEIYISMLFNIQILHSFWMLQSVDNLITGRKTVFADNLYKNRHPFIKNIRTWSACDIKVSTIKTNQPTIVHKEGAVRGQT